MPFNGTKKTAASACIICRSSNLQEVLTTPAVPVLCNQLLYRAEEARNVDRAMIVLLGCRRCGHLFNGAFDPAVVRYGVTYENSLMESPAFRRYTNGLIDRLFAASDLKSGTVVEIGCGRGEFLRLLCRRGVKCAVGFDPGRPDEVSVIGNSIVTINGRTFDETLAPATADLVCARHVLEHLPDPVSLLASLHSTYAAADCMLLIEVPNGGYTLHDGGIWDLIYEHVSYFTPSSLSQALSRAGFLPDQVLTAYGGQFLLAEARSGGAAGRPAPAHAYEEAVDFGFLEGEYGKLLAAWGSWLDTAREEGRHVALWGAGAKAAIFLNLLDHCEDRAVREVVDINPAKAGSYVVGTAHPIVPPTALCRSQPHTVLLMNPEYEGEVRMLLQRLAIRAELLPVSGGYPTCR